MSRRSAPLISIRQPPGTPAAYHGHVELEEARIIVAGATGALGEAIARELHARGAQVALAGRDGARLEQLGAELGAPTARFDLFSPSGIAPALAAATAALEGLDALVVATGVVAFGAEPELPGDVLRDLFVVNATGPIRLIREALPHLDDGGAIVALTAVVAEHPTAGMAAYSASKAALSAYLTALRRERRRSGLTVLDVRPSHLDTGFETRALAGSAPDLPPAGDHLAVAREIVDALRDGRRELAYDLRERALVPR